MATIEGDVAGHYAQNGLEQAILGALRTMGHDPNALRADDLAAVEDFHVGGRQATEELASRMGLTPDMAVLDIGSGIGGTARFLAQRHGCRVSGLDLTPDYVAVARTLTRLVGLSDRIEFQVASATDIPFSDAVFDAATLLHVGMNIADKDRLFAEVGRVLRGGAVFGLWDIMRQSQGDIRFPLPWARQVEISFVAEPEAYRRGLRAAGFEIVAERERRQFAIEFFRRMRQRAAAGGPPPLGLHLLMGPLASEKVGNLLAALEAGRLAPVEMICRRLS